MTSIRCYTTSWDLTSGTVTPANILQARMLAGRKHDPMPSTVQFGFGLPGRPSQGSGAGAVVFPLGIIVSVEGDPV